MKKIIDFVKKNYIAFTIIGVIILLTICFILILKIFTSYQNKRNIDAKELSFYQFFETKRYDFDAKVSYDGEKIINLEGINYNLLDSPIYAKEEAKVLLPKESSIIFIYQNALQQKLNKYSVISNDHNTYVIKMNNKNMIKNNFIVYLDDNTYFLPDGGILNINGKKITLSKFSYLKYANDKVIYYDYEKDQVDKYEGNIKDCSLKIDNIGIDIIKKVMINNKKMSIISPDIASLPELMED